MIPLYLFLCFILLYFKTVIIKYPPPLRIDTLEILACLLATQPPIRWRHPHGGAVEDVSLCMYLTPITSPEPTGLENLKQPNFV